jgi:ferredoxin-thioredoxin reductase catalytic chain
MTSTKTIKDTEKFVSMVANKQGWKTHPDKEFLKMLYEGLTENWNRYGYYSCPCRDASGVKENDKDIICPCVYCKPDQQEYGHCYCGLYITKDYAATGKIPKYIPERRPEKKF